MNTTIYPEIRQVRNSWLEQSKWFFSVFPFQFSLDHISQTKNRARNEIMNRMAFGLFCLFDDNVFKTVRRTQKPSAIHLLKFIFEADGIIGLLFTRLIQIRSNCYRVFSLSDPTRIVILTYYWKDRKVNIDVRMLNSQLRITYGRYANNRWNISEEKEYIKWFMNENASYYLKNIMNLIVLRNKFFSVHCFRSMFECLKAFQKLNCIEWVLIGLNNWRIWK